MMSPEDTKKFETLIANGEFTQATYERLLKRFDFQDLDLEDEYTQLVKHTSLLSRRQRDVLPDMLAVRDMLQAKKEKDEQNKAANADDKISANFDLAINAIIEEKEKSFK